MSAGPVASGRPRDGASAGTRDVSTPGAFSPASTARLDRVRARQGSRRRSLLRRVMSSRGWGRPSPGGAAARGEVVGTVVPRHWLYRGGAEGTAIAWVRRPLRPGGSALAFLLGVMIPSVEPIRAIG